MGDISQQRRAKILDVTDLMIIQPIFTYSSPFTCMRGIYFSTSLMVGLDLELALVNGMLADVIRKKAWNMRICCSCSYCPAFCNEKSFHGRWATPGADVDPMPILDPMFSPASLSHTPMTQTHEWELISHCWMLLGFCSC